MDGEVTRTAKHRVCIRKSEDVDDPVVLAPSPSAEGRWFEMVKLERPSVILFPTSFASASSFVDESLPSLAIPSVRHGRLP